MWTWHRLKSSQKRDSFLNSQFSQFSEYSQFKKNASIRSVYMPTYRPRADQHGLWGGRLFLPSSWWTEKAMGNPLQASWENTGLLSPQSPRQMYTAMVDKCLVWYEGERGTKWFMSRGQRHFWRRERVEEGHDGVWAWAAARSLVWVLALMQPLSVVMSKTPNTTTGRQFRAIQMYRIGSTLTDSNARGNTGQMFLFLTRAAQ